MAHRNARDTLSPMNARAPTPPSADDRPIWDIWLSSLWMPALTVASELGVYEALGETPTTSADLARRLELKPQGTETLLRMLVALGLLVVYDGRYQLTAVARNYLLRESPFYWGHVWSLSIDMNSIHTRLREALVVKPTPPAANTAAPGDRAVEGWESGQIDDEQAGRIARFMHSHSMAAAAGLARDVSFEGVNRLLDVGGGSGCFSIALAHRYPELRCTIMELPAMCRQAQKYIADAGLAKRTDTRSVDMFREAWPSGYDAMFFSNIFHDWSFDTCAQLAASAYAALPGNGHIYLHEMLLDDTGTAPRTAAAFSMLMLLGTRGQQFRFSELKGLLAGAGFVDIGVTPAYGYYSIVSGSKR
jgi:O-methyltransferase/methyltransferase family protein